MSSTFVHLRLHSEYSLVDGMVRVEELAARAAALGMPAIALTDQDNLFALIKFYKAMQSVGKNPSSVATCVWSTRVRRVP